MNSNPLQRPMRGAPGMPFQNAGRSVLEFLSHTRRRWYLYVPVMTIWVLAFIRIFVDPTPRVPVLFNWTDSLPYHVALAQHRGQRLERGDYVVFSFAGEARLTDPGLQGQPFFKQVRGLPGDVVTVDGRTVSINGEVVGIAKTHTFDHRPLEPIADMVIPRAHYFMQGTGADSFDSRYRESGLVRADQILATVLPLF